jgi:hypothetical protein
MVLLEMLTSKARTVAALAGKLKSAHILPGFFSPQDWKNSDGILEKILARDDLIDGVFVRSSAANEDSQSTSLVGRYLSKRGRRRGILSAVRR